MAHSIFVTPTAAQDITVAIEYYNALSPDLGYRFAEQISRYFDRIAALPTASAIRYKNVRCKPVKRFPYLIAFMIDDAKNAVNILRVFNTYLEPPPTNL